MSQPPEQPYPAQGATLQQPNLPEEEIPTQRTPRVAMPAQQSFTQEKLDGRAADSAADETEETPTQPIRRITTPTHHHPSTQQNPDGPAADNAAVDVDSVDPAIDGYEDADTVEMPSVLAVFSDVWDPAADAEKSDGQKLAPIAGHAEKIDTEPADPDDAHLPETLPVSSVAGAARDPSPRPEHQVVGPGPTKSPAGKKRLVSAGLASIALSALLVSALFVSSRDAGEVSAQSVATGTGIASATAGKPANGASTGSTDTEIDEPAIQVKGLAASARPFQTIRIQGKYRGGADTYLQVQRWEDGEWLAFPMPAKTDQSGQFTAHVELGPPGRYPLRVLDPDSGTTSKAFFVLIKS